MTTKIIVWDFSWLVLLVTCAVTYYLYIAGKIPTEAALIVNVVCVPMIFGVLVSLIFKGPWYVSMVLLAIFPISLVLVLGGDEAKPGLERFVAIIQFAFLLVGFLVSRLVSKFV